MSGLFDDFEYVTDKFKNAVLEFVSEFSAEVVTVQSDDDYVAYATYYIGGTPWLSIISQDPTDSVTQINIVGKKAIDLLKSQF